MLRSIKHYFFILFAVACLSPAFAIAAQADSQAYYVLIKIRAHWCRWCDFLDREVFDDPAIRIELAKRYADVIELDKDRTDDPLNAELLNAVYAVNSVPHVIVLRLDVDPAVLSEHVFGQIPDRSFVDLLIKRGKIYSERKGYDGEKQDYVNWLLNIDAQQFVPLPIAACSVEQATHAAYELIKVWRKEAALPYWHRVRSLPLDQRSIEWWVTALFMADEDLDAATKALAQEAAQYLVQRGAFDALWFRAALEQKPELRQEAVRRFAGTDASVEQKSLVLYWAAKAAQELERDAEAKDWFKQFYAVLEEKADESLAGIVYRASIRSAYDSDGAIGILNRVDAMDPFIAMWEKSDVYMRSNRPAEAEQVVKVGMQYCKGFQCVNTLDRLAVVQAQQQRYGDAVASTRRALAELQRYVDALPSGGSTPEYLRTRYAKKKTALEERLGEYQSHLTQ